MRRFSKKKIILSFRLCKQTSLFSNEPPRRLALNSSNENILFAYYLLYIIHLVHLYSIFNHTIYKDALYNTVLENFSFMLSHKNSFRHRELKSESFRWWSPAHVVQWSNHELMNARPTGVVKWPTFSTPAVSEFSAYLLENKTFAREAGHSRLCLCQKRIS